MTTDLLRLVALDQEDLAIVSAHLQDAVVRLGDLTYLPQERRFALVVRRFDWEARPDPQRRLTGLHFERVMAVRTRGLDLDLKDAVLNLLAMTFAEAEAEAPSGTVTLVFAEGGAVQVDVECIELQMKDLGPVWKAESLPVHDGKDRI